MKNNESVEGIVGEGVMKVDKSRLSRYFYKLHVYGGLFCAVYLFIAGISALNFQHQFLPEKETDTLSYTRNIQFDPTLKVDSLASYLRLQLGIKGHLPPWEFKENKNGKVRFKIQRPARTYDVRVQRNSNLVEVSEIHYSAGRILRSLHFGSVKNRLGDPMLDIWTIYGQVSAILAFFTVATSIWFWYKKSIKSRNQLNIILLSGVSSLIIMSYIWLIG